MDGLALKNTPHLDVSGVCGQFLSGKQTVWQISGVSATAQA
jgi:hypothetical protein